jgi:Ni,Fe-hydrogenase I cytochrome b subunit
VCYGTNQFHMDILVSSYLNSVICFCILLFHYIVCGEYEYKLLFYQPITHKCFKESKWHDVKLFYILKNQVKVIILLSSLNQTTIITILITFVIDILN